MKMKNIIVNNYKILITITAILIVIGVLFIKPQVGVADQGDFDRIMHISGLSLLEKDESNLYFIRFYHYIVPEYQISEIDKISKTIKGCSISYLIVFVSKICKLSGQTVFKTQYLAIIYSILYIFAFIITLKSLNIKDRFKLIIISSLIVFIFFDGNYLVWFNSLYGEPMMIVTFSLFIAFVLNYIHYKYVIKGTKHLMLRIVPIVIAAFLFLGSKLQVTTSLPFIIFVVGKIIWDNRRILGKLSLASLCICVYILILYPIGIGNNSDNLSKDTEYNSVFYGVLNGSKTPKQDLIDLGLNPDLSVEAGKHSYLDTDEYVKYIPGAEITNEEFYSKISNSKLAKFYLTHPSRLLKGMEYTAGKAFNTSTLLGKCSQSYSETPVVKFQRFTLWSYIREHVLPKKLYFIVSIYLIIILFTVHKYISNKWNLEVRNKILLLWVVMLIGAVQFPMPFVGNGMADTAKQLFLFNFIFDGLLLLIFSYALLKIIKAHF
ncbi:hypothetical protein [Clostridium sp.]|uniref:glycan biosynthesis hexose transferase WsfD n=1 Tax=Clostridium sp. TaxID=1506 RepID=UPI0028484E0A|nr:hypothetical protein [Clostridium sp.]MDR3597540.1 hypothetical protein [Clostridium sp.]